MRRGTGMAAHPPGPAPGAAPASRHPASAVRLRPRETPRLVEPGAAFGDAPREMVAVSSDGAGGGLVRAAAHRAAAVVLVHAAPARFGAAPARLWSARRGA